MWNYEWTNTAETAVTLTSSIVLPPGMSPPGSPLSTVILFLSRSLPSTTPLTTATSKRHSPKSPRLWKRLLCQESRIRFCPVLFRYRQEQDLSPPRPRPHPLQCRQGSQRSRHSPLRHEPRRPLLLKIATIVHLSFGSKSVHQDQYVRAVVEDCANLVARQRGYVSPPGRAATASVRVVREEAPALVRDA